MDNNSKAGCAPYQRRTILIKRHLQLRYTALIMASVVVGLMIMAAELGWHLWRIHECRPALVTPLMGELGLLLPAFAVKLTIFLVIILLIAVVISHRLAGPIYKFEKSVAQVAAGDLTHRIVLRKGDQLTELQDELNQLFESLNAAVRNDKETAEAVAARLETLCAKIQDSAATAELKELAQKLRAIAAGYKV